VATALYAGTFDPFTNGHLDVLARGAGLFERVVVAVGVRLGKQTLFEPDERVRLVEASAAAAGLEGIAVTSFDGLVVGCAREHGATVLLRGVRNGGDYEYEAIMATTNERLSPGLETVILVARPEVGFLSSTLVKEVVKAGGDASAFVPEPVAAALRARG